MASSSVGIPRRFLFWMNMPSHHQSGFMAALRAAGVDAVVVYYGRVDERRQQQGWEAPPVLPEGEYYLHSLAVVEALVPDWCLRIHIVPGYGSGFLRQLLSLLVAEGLTWVHWSEPAHPGLRWYVSAPLKYWYGRLVNRHALGALAIGAMARDDFLRWGIRAEKIRMLPYAVPAPVPGHAPAHYEDLCATYGLRFLFLGELCPRKGVDLLLEAFTRLSDISPRHDIGLFLVGFDSSQGRYQQALKGRRGADQVHFLPPVKPDQIAAVIAGTSVLVLPSRFDGWGMVLAEAAALGKAIIGSTGAGAAAHLVEPGVNGFRVEPEVSALVQAMAAYDRDRSLIGEHGEQSRLIFSRFTPEANVVRFIDAIHSLEGRGND